MAISEKEQDPVQILLKRVKTHARRSQLLPKGGSAIQRRCTRTRPCDRCVSRFVNEQDDPADNQNDRPAWRETSIISLPSSPDSRLASEIIHVLDTNNLRRSWFAFMPSCAGHDKRADTAMHAAICAHHYRWRGDERNAATGDLQYGRAMELLRTDLNTDDAAILTIAILTCYVFLMRGKAYSLEAVAHINGVASIMRARPKTVQTSALASAILFCLAEEYFRFACIFGTPSPFDDERWLDLEPSELYGPLSSEVRSLRKLSHKLVLRLPRLIAAVRVCRENGQHASFADAFQLAEELWQLGDDETETHLLHQVKVVPTQDPDVCKIVAYSFSFHSTEQLIAAALYWWTRLMTINLCSKLHHLCPNNQASAKSSLPHHPDLTHEQTRLIANMIMSWQHATSSGQTRWLPSFVQTMEALWVALSDLETFRDLPVETTRSLVLRRYKEVLHEQPIEVTPELIESMGGLLVGGPIDGPASMVGLIERHYGQSF